MGIRSGTLLSAAHSFSACSPVRRAAQKKREGRTDEDDYEEGVQIVVSGWKAAQANQKAT